MCSDCGNTCNLENFLRLMARREEAVIGAAAVKMGCELRRARVDARFFRSSYVNDQLTPKKDFCPYTTLGSYWAMVNGRNWMVHLILKLRHGSCSGLFIPTLKVLVKVPGFLKVFAPESTVA